MELPRRCRLTADYDQGVSAREFSAHAKAAGFGQREFCPLRAKMPRLSEAAKPANE